MRPLLALALALAIVACSSNKSTPESPADTGVDEVATDAGPQPYELTVLDGVRITSNSAGPNFQNAKGDLPALHGGPFASVKLHVELATTCFPFDNWKTDKPPAGQYWPADCDAFDRNFETSLEDPANPKAPGLELVRAITPFGGPLTIDEDVTDVFNAPNVQGPRTIHVTIPTWSDGEGKVSGSNGGWNVTVKLEVTPGEPPHKVLAATPLFYDNVGPMNATHSLMFTAPAGTTSGRIDYRVTGHGGDTGPTSCGGNPSDEFCKRTHTVTLDGAALPTFQPWRSDCNKLCTVVKNTSGVGPTSYCQQNPCGALASVRAPRANWCPGSETPPISFDQAALKAPGAHTFGFAIASVADGATWRVSATYFAYGD